MYDEPTAGLDPVASTVVEDLIRDLHEKHGEGHHHEVSSMWDSYNRFWAAGLDVSVHGEGHNRKVIRAGGRSVAVALQRCCPGLDGRTAHSEHGAPSHEPSWVG